MLKTILLFCFIIPFLSFSQNYLEIGDKFFNHNNFKQAISYYEKESKNKDVQYKLLAIERLGQTYIKLHDFELANKWLTEAIKLDPKNAKLLFQKAETLKKLKKFDEAKKTYLEHYELSKEEQSLSQAAFCDSLSVWSSTVKSEEFEISEFKIANSPYRDFSPVILRDSIYFVSDRGNSADDNKGVLDHKYAIPHLDFYVAGFNKNSNEYKDIKASPFAQIQTGHHEGPMTFADNGETIIFTRTNTGLKSPYQNIHPTQLFTAYKYGNKWTEANNNFKMNNIEHSTGHPCISKDGKTLVFMADAGSNFSNSNIYIAKWNPSNKNWGEFRPLGDHINTRSNELFPFFDEDMNLYFSSLGLPGYGGLDVFFAKYNAKKDDWEKPVNLKAPINSEYDDFGFYQYGKSGGGFFCSDRNGGTGGDDIYLYSSNSSSIVLDHDLVEVEKNTFFSGQIATFKATHTSDLKIQDGEKYKSLQLNADDSTYSLIQEKNGIPHNKIDFVLEKPTPNSKYAVQIHSNNYKVNIDGILKNDTKSVVPNQKLFVFENDVLVDTLKTGKNGEYSYTCDKEKEYRIAQLDSLTQDLKPKYLKIEVVNSKKQELSNVDINIKKQGKQFLSFLLNKNQNVIRVPNHNTLNINISKKYHISIDTNLSVNLSKGIDTLFAHISIKEIPSYILKGHVFENFKNEKLSIKGVDVEFHYKGKVIDQNHSFETGEFEIKAFPMEKINLTLNKRGYVGIDTIFQLDTSKIKTVSFELKRITEGATVQLKEIYFEYNKAEITKESVPNLDKIAKFLLSNPSVKVELSSHTDTRGSAAYNLDLSQRRAESVTKFLIHKGVKHNKLHARGYGATQPIIQNAQTEEEHKTNRRTEIKILKADDAHSPDFQYRIVIKTSNKPLDTSDEVFEKFPLLKSTSNEAGDIIYFIGPYEHTDDLKKQWALTKESGFNDLYIEKLLAHTVIEKITDIESVK